MPAVMIIFGQVIDELVDYSKNGTNETTSMQDFLDSTSRLCMYNAICGVAIFICNYIYVSFFSLAAANQAFRIRCLFMKSILRQNIGWFDTNQTGDFASRITDDLTRIQDGMGEKIGLCISLLSSTVLCVGVALYYGWILGLVILSTTPVAAIAVARMAKVQANASRQELAAYAAAGAVAEEVLSSIRTVVAFGGETKEIKRYENCLEPARKKGIKRGLMTSIMAALTWFCIFAGYALAFWYGVKLIIESEEKDTKEYTGGKLIIIFFNVGSAAMFFGQTAPYFEAFALARGAAAKVYQIIDREPSIDSSSDSGIKPLSLDGYIRLKNVAFTYPSRPTVQILTELSLDVQPGEKIALIGHSGCGKSTVIQLILRFYDVDSGSVEMDGINVKDLTVGWLRDQMGFVGQEPVLFSTTIEENIKLGKLNASTDEVIEAAKIANVHDFIASLPKKYKTLVGERGTQLSGGQKQRIAIARALIKNPKILLLDEATSALDNESEAVVQAALDKVLRRGRTTIVVAHRLSTIRTADKIVFLSDGKVKEFGTHEELMKKKGCYYELVETQAKNAEEDAEEEEVNDELCDLDTKKSLVSNESVQSDEGKEKRILHQFASGSTSLYRQISSVSNRLFRQTSAISGQSKVSPADEEDVRAKASPSKMRLLKISAPEWPYALVGCIAAVLMGFHFPFKGIILGDIIGVLGKNVEEMRESYLSYCLLFVVMACTSFICTFLQIFMFTVAGEKLTSRLRKMVFENIITQDISFFDQPTNSVGSLCSRLTSDASSVQGCTGSRISTVLQAISTMGVCIFIALYYNYKIGLVVLVFIPFVLLATYWEGSIVSGQSIGEQIATEGATKVAIEAIEGIRTVASLHQETKFFVQFRDALTTPYKKSRLKSHIRGLSYGFAQGVQAFAYAAAMYYGSRLVAEGELEYADLLKVIKGVLEGVMMVGQAVAFSPDYQRAKGAAVRIIHLLDFKPKIDAFSQTGLIQDSVEGFIRFEKVYFNYPSRSNVKVLRGLELAIEPGKTVALVGSSGCGKSTCVQLIERFYDPQLGEVRIDEENIRELKVSEHRKHLGIVSQEPTLFAYSIAENIAYGDNSREVGMNEIIAAARQANIHNFITSLPQGYETPVGDKGAQLSGGQKQRVAIARALVRNPKILLLDEATSALDAESEKVVQEALDKARAGRTCLVIAHRLSTIQNADVIMVMHKGRIVERGTHQELLNLKGYYFNLNNTQAMNR
ncbi:ATP-dependent translocase ABCB1-like [Uloborus diversus]|uniref:ATP-dependent translocase ABCB1-like n=1 Tax=Uloborus diversus TaxID=327109 RepID=UPI0024099C6C|nr:ATP-dependent translocase ABCB1-like [Uloborus diversus]